MGRRGGEKNFKRKKWILINFQKIPYNNNNIRACLIYTSNNADADILKTPLFMRESSQIFGLQKLLKTPKWRLTFLNEETGEIVETNDLEMYYRRRAKRFKTFFEYAERLKKEGRYSFLFITLTRANVDNYAIRKFLEGYKKRLYRRGINVYGYLWVLEVGKKSGMIHYHVCIIVDYIDLRNKKIPDFLKPDNGLWGSLTRVEFIKKSVKNYLMNYLRKEIPNVYNTRTYGISLRKCQKMFKNKEK